MKIYFACSITGGRQDEGIYQVFVKELEALGCDVPTAHIAETGIEEMDAAEDPVDIYERDVSWIKECNLLVAEVSTPSHGVGFEIGYALNLGIPVVCFHRTDVTISKMILGNPNPDLQIYSYRDQEEAIRLLRQLLSEC
jgi:nucleoside 2-deoxyribosyltransferase